MRTHGTDPAASEVAKAKRKAALRRRATEEQSWDDANPTKPAPADFTRLVLPVIQDVPVRRLAAATGLSVSYCAMIRRGLHIPHVRWWGVLATAGSDGPLIITTAESQPT